MCGEEEAINADNKVTVSCAMSNADLSDAIEQTFNLIRAATTDSTLSSLHRHLGILLGARAARAVQVVSKVVEYERQTL